MNYLMIGAISGCLVVIMGAFGSHALDGILDDSIWADVPSIDDFSQLEPNLFKPPSYRTSVKIVHDNNYLYIDFFYFVLLQEILIVVKMVR